MGGRHKRDTPRRTDGNRTYRCVGCGMQTYRISDGLRMCKSCQEVAP